MSITIAQVDAVEFVASRPGGSVHVCMTDPAYESLEKHRKVGTTTRLAKSAASSNEWFAIFKDERYHDFFGYLHGAMAKNGLVYVHTDAVTFPVMLAAAKRAGFTFWNLLTWDKQKIGMGYHWRHQTEFIMFLSNGHGRKLRNCSDSDLLSFKAVRNGYPTEKPFDLVHHVLVNSMELGDTVLDPFCGSGVVGDAALCLNAANIWLGDTSEQAVTATRKRLTTNHAHGQHELSFMVGGSLHQFEAGKWV